MLCFFFFFFLLYRFNGIFLFYTDPSVILVITITSVMVFKYAPPLFQLHFLTLQCAFEKNPPSSLKLLSDTRLYALQDRDYIARYLVFLSECGIMVNIVSVAFFLFLFNLKIKVIDYRYIYVHLIIQCEREGQ